MRTVALHLALAMAATTALVVLVLPTTTSSFTDSTGSHSNEIAAAPDWTPPNISAAIVQKAQGGAIAKLRPGESFYIYAKITDSGNPPSGVGTSQANVGSIATASTAALHAGSWTVEGTAYNYRTDALTAKSALAAGSYAWSIKASDAAGNGPTTANESVAFESSAFTGTDFRTADGAGNTGLPQRGDRMIFDFNRAPEPDSILPGWDGTSTAVDVKLVDGGLYGLSGAADLIAAVDDAGNPIGLGYVTLNGDYVASGRIVTFAASSMVLDGSTVTITLGQPDLAARDDGHNRTPVWSPGDSAIDQYGIGLTASPVTQSGWARRQF